MLPFGLCNAPGRFQRAILNTFIDLINEGLEVYMDDFTPYGDDFDQPLQTLEKVLYRCISTRLCLRNVKCHMMMTEGIILGHYISIVGIQVILLLPTPCTQMDLCSFLRYVGYYHRFIKKNSQITAPLYGLTGNVDFKWFDKCDTFFTNFKKLVSTHLYYVEQTRNCLFTYPRTHHM